MSESRYDKIARTYKRTRRADPRIETHIHKALGNASTVLNVGAGTGSYEPHDRVVVAVDPARRMLQQRPHGAAPAVQAVAEALPFADGAFDAAMAILTLHHWRDLATGLTEMRRIAQRQVVFFFEPALAKALWIVADYFPEVLELPSERNAPGVTDLAQHLDVMSCDPVPVTADCVDGFAGCYWNRPEAYLNPDVQEGMSCFSQVDPALRVRGLDRLRADLESGAWDTRHGHLRSMPQCDLGYRILTAGH